VQAALGIRPACPWSTCRRWLTPHPGGCPGAAGTDDSGRASPQYRVGGRSAHPAPLGGRPAADPSTAGADGATRRVAAAAHIPGGIRAQPQFGALPAGGRVANRGSPVPAASSGAQPAARAQPRADWVARRHGPNLDRARTCHVRDVVRRNDLVIAVRKTPTRTGRSTSPAELVSARPSPGGHRRPIRGRLHRPGRTDRPTDPHPRSRELTMTHQPGPDGGPSGHCPAFCRHVNRRVRAMSCQPSGDGEP